MMRTGSGRELTKGDELMSNLLSKLNVKFQGLKSGEEGQDLVEYALLLALIALICIAAINGVGTAVNSVFLAISTSLA